jgi:hypothetical protein
MPHDAIGDPDRERPPQSGYELSVFETGERLRKWLSLVETEETAPQSLADWIQGYSLPAVGHDEPVSIWIGRALVYLNSAEVYDTTLACRMAAFLRQHMRSVISEGEFMNYKPKEEDIMKDRALNQFLYDFFAVCAMLGRHHQLTQALQEFCDDPRSSNALAIIRKENSLLRAAFIDTLTRHKITIE